MMDRASEDTAPIQSQQRIVVSLASLRQMQAFNDRAAIPVYFDVMKSAKPDITITGTQSRIFSLWETRSVDAYVTKPHTSVDVVTIRFVTSGRIVYRSRTGTAMGTTTCATLVGFEDLRELQTSNAFSAVSATIAVEALAAAEAALTGKGPALPRFAPIADMAVPGLKALFCTLSRILSRDAQPDARGDLISPLIQEIVGYQLLSAWPRLTGATVAASGDITSRHLGLALEYIHANLSFRLTLADIAQAAGISVRSLQSKFRQEIGQTPLEFIIDQRLAKVHRDLAAPVNATLSIADIARRWGFVHISDFTQRYRRIYGSTPSGTRRGAGRGL